jgi:YidC/Oxa1 family membrane protein insertase
MSFLWNTVIYYPLINAIVGLYRLTQDLGLSIILLTVGLRLIMTPLVVPSLRLSKKMQELAPELAKLKEQYKNDKQGLIAAQTALYKQHGANPASGCLPQILQLVVLFALFKVFTSVLSPNGSEFINNINTMLYPFNSLSADFQFSTNFLYLNLSKPDLIHLPGFPFPLPGLFVFLAAAIQLVSSIMMMPAVKKEALIAQKTEKSSDDFMAGFQQQSLYLFPLMTLIFGYSMSAGLMLYWMFFSLISIIQQYFVIGWGGLTPWLFRLGLLKSRH